MHYMYVRMYGYAVCTVGMYVFVSILCYAFCSIPHIEFSMVYTDVYHVLYTVVLCKCV